MNNLVKMITDDDGNPVNSPKWCAINPFGDADRTLCTGEVFGYGESIAEYATKKAERGITCSNCKEMIKHFKSIKL